ncbi:hypothetical protein J2848_000328 [Azospirillum lipoferum]|uniref:DUF6898 domain-containing protein n=1 Tax=Azospirillum lipoferum TaxID=193 RepID=A0A5A9GUW2_AZOLI|nr:MULTISPECIES: hypothetical protein [Azospirillum]KAA0597189.1 hypothetical protein FZ942_08810 [Azospirillum lipoferum]MCP1608692.1 hypothetical protein [Azospirillum lipoferum]MDW5535990.1 hypothetical protein [Azospirillum sp. NL1]
MTGGDVLFEFQRVGSYLRVTAIDAKTGVEVTVAGPATGSQELLKRTAINKLRFVQNKGAGPASPAKPEPPKSVPPKPGAKRGGGLY